MQQERWATGALCLPPLGFTTPSQSTKHCGVTPPPPPCCNPFPPRANPFPDAKELPHTIRLASGSKPRIRPDEAVGADLGCFLAFSQRMVEKQMTIRDQSEVTSSWQQQAAASNVH